MKVASLGQGLIKRKAVVPRAEDVGTSASEPSSDHMGAGPSSAVHSMPGAFDAKAISDITHVVENPEEYLVQLQNAWLRKHHDALRQPQLESPSTADDDEQGDKVDWRLYSSPPALADASKVFSEPLTEIIPQSIVNVQLRAQQELQREKEDAATRKAEEEAAALEAAKNKEPYLPVKMGKDAQTEDEDAESTPIEIKPDCDTLSLLSRRSFIQEQVDRRRKFGFRKLFHRGGYEKGESASAGAAREAMRLELENRLSKANVESTAPDTQETLARLRRNKTVRVPETQELVECVSCLDDFAKKDVVKVVCHSYCNDCFVRLITAACANEQQWPPKCCLNQIPFRTVLNHIPEDLKTTFQERQSEWEVPIGERVYCHVPECSAMVAPKNINLAKRVATCPQKHTTCTICRRPAHGKNECPEDQEMNLTNMLAEDEGWKRCSQCRALVEHREACQHMTCRCGYQFCYVCCRRWHSCSCTMAQLNELKAAAAGRRNERRRREAQEADELRDILAQIEELERQEAAVQERHRQAMLKERARGEILRRQTVEVKFQQLARILDALHETQGGIIEWQQEADAKDLATDAKNKEEELKQKQEEELSQIKEKIASRMGDMETRLDSDFALRAARERKIESDYEEQLKEYWAEKEGSAEEIESAMLSLRQRMDKGYQLWQEWKALELETYRAKLQDEQTIREELMYSAKHRLLGRYEDMEKELARRLAAEKRWAQEIFAERKVLLAAAEAAEMVGDADSMFGIDLDAPRPVTPDAVGTAL